MKKFSLLVIVLVGIILEPFHVQAYDFEYNGLFYDVINPAKRTCGVSGIDESKVNSEIIIPSHVSYLGKDLTVISILERAFEYCSKIKSVYVPQGVTEIEDYAFSRCENLEEITFPSSLIRIGSSVFLECENLLSVKISDLKAWCEINFANPLLNKKTKLLLNGELVSKLSFDSSITRINADAFYGYSYLTEVDLIDNIQYIGIYCFAECANLYKLRIGRGIKTIPDHAFYNCTNLTELCIADSDEDLVFPGNRESSQKIHGTFRDCNLKRVYIGRNAFMYTITNDYRAYRSAVFENQEIDSVVISPHVTSINYSYFNGCGYYPVSVKNVRNLIILPSKDPLLCFFEKYDYEKKLLENGPFKNINPTSLVLGRNFESEHVELQDLNIRGVKNYLDDCTDLRTLEIGEYVTDISCLNLDKNDNISNITVKSSTPPTCNTQAFTKKTYLYSLLKVPSASIEAYKSAPVWDNFWNIEGCDFSSSGVDEIEIKDNSMSIITEKGRIYILNKDKNSIVRVFTIQGALIKETRDDEIDNLPAGLYVVKVGNKSFKVSLR